MKKNRLRKILITLGGIASGLTGLAGLPWYVSAVCAALAGAVTQVPAALQDKESPQ